MLTCRSPSTYLLGKMAFLWQRIGPTCAAPMMLQSLYPVHCLLDRSHLRISGSSSFLRYQLIALFSALPCYQPRIQMVVFSDAYLSACLSAYASVCTALTVLTNCRKPWPIERIISFLVYEVTSSEYLGQSRISRSSGQGQGHRSKIVSRYCVRMVCLSILFSRVNTPVKWCMSTRAFNSLHHLWLVRLVLAHSRNHTAA